VVDSDGTGQAAKSEVQAMKKGISKIPGVANVVVTTSGRPLNASSLRRRFLEGGEFLYQTGTFSNNFS